MKARKIIGYKPHLEALHDSMWIKTMEQKNLPIEVKAMIWDKGNFFKTNITKKLIKNKISDMINNK